MKRTTAIHEAAHAVIAYRTYGGSLYSESASIIPNEYYLGNSSSMSMQDGLEEGFVLSLLAGWIAQSRLDPRMRARGCSQDFQGVRDLLPVAGITLTEAIARTRELVSKHWKEIEAVADELEAHLTLDEIEVSVIADAIIGFNLDGESVTREDLEKYRENRRNVNAPTSTPG